MALGPEYVGGSDEEEDRGTPIHRIPSSDELNIHTKPFMPAKSPLSIDRPETHAFDRTAGPSRQPPDGQSTSWLRGARGKKREHSEPSESIEEFSDSHAPSVAPAGNVKQKIELFEEKQPRRIDFRSHPSGIKSGMKGKESSKVFDMVFRIATTKIADRPQI